MYEITKLEELQTTYYDLFKDVNGFRPRHISDEAWNSESWLENEIKSLSIEMDEIINQEKIQQENNIKKFEEKISELISIGANNRSTALRWMFDAEEDYYSKDYFCYNYGLPYNYLK